MSLGYSNYAARLKELGLSDIPFIPDQIHTTAVDAALASHIWMTTKENSSRERGAIFDVMLRSGLQFEANLDATLAHVVSIHDTSPWPNIASLQQRSAKQALNTRQLIKVLGVNAKFLLAASGAAAYMGKALVAGYSFHGDWNTFVSDLALSCEEVASKNMDPSLAASHAAWQQVSTAIATLRNTTTPASTSTTKAASTMTNTTALPAIAAAINSIPSPMVTAINAMLASSGATGVTLDALKAEAVSHSETARLLEATLKKAQTETDDLMAQLRAAKSAAPISLTMAASTSGAIPAGKMEMVDAESLFPVLKGVKLRVPAWKWDAPHPDVPKKIDGYIFRKPMLLRALRCLANGENLWLQGHTGSGKTTFIEQIANGLGWPVLRIALDAAIDRSELVGRTTLKSDGQGGTTSEWLLGAIERAIPNAYILLLDEMDAGHPNSLYTLQPVLEGKGLTLLEDGGRIVQYHPMTRIVATGNTAGSGDESGLYPACRILSAATLDRFAEFIEVPYLTTQEESKLIETAVGTKTNVATKLAKFASEMRAAFTKGELPVSYSPRRSVAFARAVEDYLGMGLGITFEGACDLALAGKLMQATPNEHRARLTEIARTCLATTGNVPSL